MQRLRLVFVSTFVPLALAASSQSAVLRVNASAPAGGDGASWSTAFRDLQDAIDAAPIGEPTQIWIAAGTYRPDRGTGVRSLSFELKPQLALLGGFEGDELNAWERSPAAHVTVLSGDLLGDDGPNFANVGDNSFHVVSANALSAPATLDGLVIRGGNASGFSIYGRGSGVFSIASALVLNGCTFEWCRATEGGALYAIGGAIQCSGGGAHDCVATNGGGALAGANASFVVSNATFTSNTTQGLPGGAIRLVGGSIFLAGGSLDDNSSNSQGGAIALDGADAVIAGASITNNSSSSSGGAVWAGGTSGTLTLLGCEASGNSSASGGGAVYTSRPLVLNGGSYQWNVGSNGGAVNASLDPGAGTVSISGAVFQANESVYPGSGGAVLASADLGITIDGCVFTNNFANKFQERTGGGAWFNGPLTVRDSIFEQNQAWQGGAFRQQSGSTLVDNCLFLYNDASGGGGAYLSDSGTLTTATVSNCRFEGNTANSEGGAIFPNLVTTVRDSTFVGNSAGAGGALSAYVKAIVRCDFIANSCTDRASAVRITTQASPYLANCRFLGNVSTGTGVASGGALQCEAFGASATDVATVANCLFSGNQSQAQGAGVLVYGSAKVAIVDCTISQNLSPMTNDGVFVNGGALAVSNSIIWSNGGTSEATQIAGTGGATFAINSSCIQGWTGGLGGAANIGSNPLFVNPTGPDLAVGTADDDLRLQPSSPCVNSGNAGLLPPDTADLDGDGDVLEPLPLDLDDVTRVVGTLDRGAYERQTLAQSQRHHHHDRGGAATSPKTR
ncbi:MAG: right-handed parallel beta-helix repeat-containing protein [Phycisphaerales bacterium]